MGTGNITVEFLSAAMVLRVCRYLSWMAAGDLAMISAASFKARDAFCSPSAAITFARASRDDSASAAMALCAEVNKWESQVELQRADPGTKATG